jgi:hypothetical protein
MDEEGEIIFSAKYRDWVVIKKMSVDAGTKPEEVSAILASINSTLMRKSYDFIGINREQIEAYAQSLAKGKRKALGSLVEVLGSVKPGELKEKLLACCPDPKMLPIAESFFLKTLIETVGFKTSLDADALTAVYPHLKIAKPRGNFGKKKK